MDRRAKRELQRSTLASAERRARGRVHAAPGYFESTRCIVTRGLPLVHHLGDWKQPPRRDMCVVVPTTRHTRCIRIDVNYDKHDSSRPCMYVGKPAIFSFERTISMNDSIIACRILYFDTSSSCDNSICIISRIIGMTPKFETKFCGFRV